ncbi:MAG: hypothetical protein JRI68_22815, partial [Deltaproteobacteria bacterium]|nr:hypothetical protein [Deltaproteobacteria bacterium]
DSGMPTGVTVTPNPLVIPQSQNSGIINVAAVGTADLGAATLTLTDNGGLATAVAVPLMVADPPGTLDESFDFDGIVYLNAGPTNLTGRSVAELPDGSIIVGATLGNSGWRVLRLGADGTNDAAFEANATAALPSTGRLYAVVTSGNPNPKIYAVGQSTAGGATVQLTVVRMHENGSADSGYGTNGLTSLTYTGGFDGTVGHWAALQPDGKLVVAGQNPGNGGFALVARFGTTGTVGFTYQGVVQNVTLEGVLVEPGGNIIAGGTDDSGTAGYHLVRLQSGGALDTTFNNTGHITFATGPPHYGFEVLRNSSGEYVICGHDGGSSFDGGALGKVDSTGAAIWSGNTELSYLSSDRVYGCAMQADDKILVTGEGWNSQGGGAFVGRRTVNNSADSSFSNGGVLFMDTPTPQRALYDVDLLADGRIVAVGNHDTNGLFVTRIWD